MLPMPSNTIANFVKPWFNKIKNESNNEILAEFYPSMQLGGKPAPGSIMLSFSSSALHTDLFDAAGRDDESAPRPRSGKM